MTDPEPQPNGEQLTPETIETLRRNLLGLRSDSISQVNRYERMLESLGHPVEPAIRKRRRGRLTRTTK